MRQPLCRIGKQAQSSPGHVYACAQSNPSRIKSSKSVKKTFLFLLTTALSPYCSIGMNEKSLGFRSYPQPYSTRPRGERYRRTLTGKSATVPTARRQLIQRAVRPMQRLVESSRHTPMKHPVGYSALLLKAPRRYYRYGGSPSPLQLTPPAHCWRAAAPDS